MADLKAPGLGPLVGHTTDSTCRIWIRADVPAQASSGKRIIGLIGIVEPGNKISDAWYFRLHREDDCTGAFNLGDFVALGLHQDDVAAEKKANPGAAVPDPEIPKPLAPDTTYTIRVGTFEIDDPDRGKESVPDWQVRGRLPPIDPLKNALLELDESTSEAKFRTFPRINGTAASLSFLFGSCRYPGILNSSVKRADEIYGPMLAHFQAQGAQPQFSLMVGDQIYADREGPLDPLKYENYQERYLVAWRTSNFRRLTRQSTTYMILDDHEITNNWTMDEIEKGSQELYAAASTAYLNYQWSTGPRSFGKKAYYKFTCGGYPLFVLDTRNGRYKQDPGLTDNHLLGFPDTGAGHPGQLEFLLGWLVEQQKAVGDAPKFIVTSSVFVPNLISERLDPKAGLFGDNPFEPQPVPKTPKDILYKSNLQARDDSDGWAGFPNTRLALLEQIVDEKVQNVIFLSGDIHCSCVAELDFAGTNAAKALKSFAITSSPFFWNLGHDDPNSFVHDSRLDKQKDPFPILGTKVAMNYVAYGFASVDNFARVDIDKAAATLKVSFFGRHGERIEVANRDGHQVPEISLTLAPW